VVVKSFKQQRYENKEHNSHNSIVRKMMNETPVGHSRQAKGRLHHKLFVPTVIVNDETRLMQVVRVLVQHPPLFGEAICFRLPMFAGPGTGYAENLTQLGTEGLLCCFVRMQLQTERAKTYTCQALVHYIERRSLLGDKQHSFSDSQAMGDQVGDCL
jgi:hypothetical protein